MVEDISSLSPAPRVDSAIGPGESVIPEEDRFSRQRSGFVISEGATHHAERRMAVLRTIITRLVRRPSAEGLAPTVSILDHLIPGVEGCIILLLDPLVHRLRAEAVVNLSQEFIPVLSYNEQKTRLLTTAAEQANPFLVIYLPGNRQFSSLWRLANREGIRTLLLIPWRDHDGSLLGAILFTSSQAFSPNEQAIAVVTLLTDLMSTALSEARAHQDNESLKATRDNSDEVMMAFRDTGDTDRIAGDDRKGMASPEVDTSPREQGKKTDPDVVSVLSHELLSPLTLIKGYASTLLQIGEAITEEQKRQYLQGIDSATTKLTRLLENFRDISRLEAGTPRLNIQPTSLPDLIRKSISEIQNQTTKHVIKLRLFRPMPRVNIDRQKIEQLITNLLVNALKYSPQGGDIEVVVRQVRDEEELRKTLGKSPVEPPCLIVSVTDPGIGIPDKEVEAIFRRFYRVDNRLTRVTSGAGLGLYICKIIVEAHGGHIWARSGVGEGSTLSFSLPVA